MRPAEMVALYEYNAWANRRSMGAASALGAAEFHQNLGSSFRSVRDTLAHVFGAEWVWLARFEGVSPPAFPDASEFTDAATLQSKWEEFAPALLQFVRGLTQEDLDRVIQYNTMKFGVYSNPMWQSLQHLVNHGTYHRGQVTTMLRQLAAQPAPTDLMHFYRERQAQA